MSRPLRGSRAIPIIRLHGVLLVSIQVALTDRLVVELSRDVTQEIRAYAAQGLVVEVSGVDVCDSFTASCIQGLAQLAGLMGVRAVLAGLTPGMVITLVEMGMGLDGVETALDLETALSRLGLCERAAARDGAPTRDLALLLGESEP